GAYTLKEGTAMKLLSAEVGEGVAGDSPGRIKEVSKGGILVAAGRGDLLITRIQMPGKQAVDVSEYIKGNKIEIGTFLG
ncbi:MAG: methionyl-tRNA formyltransferase, partial [Anaerovoracaceae bacterium]